MKYLYGILLFATYTTVSCSGLYLMKASESLISVRFVIGGTLYAAGAAMWIVILRIFPLSMAFPVAAGSLIVTTTLTGYFLLSERISLSQLVGIGLVLVGIVLIGASKP